MRTYRLTVFAIAVSALLLASCNRNVKEEGPSEAPRVITLDDRPVDTFPFTNGQDPAKDIVGAIMRLKTVPFWTSESSVSTLPKTKIVLRFEAPNRYMMSGPEGDLISIGGESWIKNDGGWTKSDFPFGDLGGVNPNLSMTDFNAKAQPQLLRGQKESGEEFSLYSYRDDASVNTLWIDPETGLLMKTVAQSTVKGNTFTRTTTYDYKTPVSIEAPQSEKK